MKPALIDIKGIGPATVDTLAEHRINSVNALARASIDKIAAIPGFSEARAAMVIDEAADLLSDTAITPSADDSDKQQGKKDKKNKNKGKGKSKDKDKKKHKGKKKRKDKKKDKK